MHEVETRDAVAFWQFSAERTLFWGCSLLGAPWSRAVLLLDVASNGLESWCTVQPTGGRPSGVLGSIGVSAIDNALQACAVVVIGDGELCDLPPPTAQRLVDFYENGGTVFVLPFRGGYDVGLTLEELFGVDWRLTQTADCAFALTPRGRELLGADAPNELPTLYKAHLLEVPEADAVFNEREPRPRDYFGLPDEPSPNPDEGEVEDEASYASYLRNFKPATVLAAHQNGQGGRIVYFGDYRTESTDVRDVFARVCCLPARQL